MYYTTINDSTSQTSQILVQYNRLSCSTALLHKLVLTTIYSYCTRELQFSTTAYSVYLNSTYTTILLQYYIYMFWVFNGKTLLLITIVVSLYTLYSTINNYFIKSKQKQCIFYTLGIYQYTIVYKHMPYVIYTINTII